MATSSDLRQRLEEIQAMRELAEYCAKAKDGLLQYYEAYTFAGYEGTNPDEFTYLSTRQRNIYRVALNLMQELDSAGALIWYPRKPSRIPVEIAIRNLAQLLKDNGALGYTQTETERAYNDYSISHAMREELAENLEERFKALRGKVPPIVQSIVDVFIRLEADFVRTINV